MTELVSEKEIATRLGRSIVTVRRWRKTGIGPPYYEINGRACYLESEFEEWLKQKRQ